MTIFVTQHYQEQESVILVVGCNLQKCSNDGRCIPDKDWCDSDYNCSGDQVCEIFALFCVYMVVNVNVE